jgi:hypothetical protein
MTNNTVQQASSDPAEDSSDNERFSFSDNANNSANNGLTYDFSDTDYEDEDADNTAGCPRHHSQTCSCRWGRGWSSQAQPDCAP